jgi:hypothetical protein
MGLALSLARAMAPLARLSGLGGLMKLEALIFQGRGQKVCTTKSRYFAFLVTTWVAR